MSNLLEVRVTVLCFYSLFFLTTALFTGKTIESVKTLVADLDDHGRSNRDQRPVKYTLIGTAVSSVCFTLAALTKTIDESIRLTKINDESTYKDFSLGLEGKRSLGRIMMALVFYFQCGGYLLTLMILIQRLILVFDGTAFSLSETSIKWSRVILVLNSVLIVTWISMYASGGIGFFVSSIVGFSTAVIYGAQSIWTALSFLSKTRSLVIYSGSEEVSSGVLNVALKLAILTTVSILSTVFIGFLNTIVSFQITSASDAVVTVLFACDTTLNAYCLLCTLKTHVHYYDLVFGRIHQWCMDHMCLEKDIQA